MKKRVSLLVTDLDNTLYDWVGMWHSAFDAMMKEIIRISGFSREILEPEIQKIFQKYGTTEYPFLIEKIPSLINKHPNQDLTIIYDEAIKAYAIARKQSLSLYPGVLDTLQTIKNSGSMIVAFTESREFYTLRRIKKLSLDGLLDFVYSPPDHKDIENPKRLYSETAYKFNKTIQKNIEEGEYKPNPHILMEIINSEGIQGHPEETIYLGDSLMKDIKMAQDAGITDVHAKYGMATNSAAYDALRRVTHWTQEDVEREKKVLAGGAVYPTYVLEKSIDEIFNYFDFVPHNIPKLGG